MAAETWAGIGHVRNVEYDVATKDLQVLFENGRRYVYRQVSFPEWEALQKSESKGSHLRRVVQPRHRFEEVKG